MALGHDARASHALQIEQLLSGHMQQRGQVAGTYSVHPSIQGLFDHDVHPLAVPPAVHIGFAQAKRALPQDAPVQILVVDLNIPRTIAVNPNIRLFRQRLQNVFCLHVCLLAWASKLMYVECDTPSMILLTF